jgi:CheY-like chemotaxis protein
MESGRKSFLFMKRTQESPMTEQPRKQTRRLAPLQRPPTGGLKPATGFTQNLPTPPWAIRFEINGQSLSLRLAAQGRAFIGRADPDNNYYPEIDLGPFGAVEKGVSRRHAEIRSNEQHLLVIDLGSTNGTRLNGHRLLANEPYRLRHGDTLEIGMTKLKVQFVTVPIHEGVKIMKKTTGMLTQPDDEETANSGPRRVLVVDADMEMATALEQLLIQIGYRALVVHSTGTAMRVIASRLPDAIILDLRMPDFPGTEIVRMIRSDLARQKLPIFVVSNERKPEEIQAALEAGATLFLSKPVGLDELLQALESFVGSPTRELQK